MSTDMAHNKRLHDKMTGASESNGHTWAWMDFGGRKLEVCVSCDRCRRADDKNSPCPGPVRIGLRLER